MYVLLSITIVFLLILFMYSIILIVLYDTIFFLILVRNIVQLTNFLY
jgi:hypothetical protein